MPRKNRTRKQILSIFSPKFFFYLVLAIVVGVSYYYLRYLGRDRVGIVIPGNVQEADSEHRALARFLDKRRNTEYRLIPSEKLINGYDELKGLSLVWIHEDDIAKLKAYRHKGIRNTLTRFVREGGALLLSLQAADLTHDLGWEPRSPETVEEKLIDEGFGRKKGIRAFGSHPVFGGLHGGSYFFHPKSDMTIRKTGFFGNQRPEKGKVSGVGWSYVFLNEDEKLMIEYEDGKGRVLALGAFLYFSVPNFQRTELEMVAENLVSYLCGRQSNEKRNYWTFNERDTYPVAFNGKQEDLPPSEPWNLTQEPFLLRRERVAEAFWDVAGRRLLIMGKESGGVDEIWSHPFMALQNYRVGVSHPGMSNFQWLSDYPSSVIVHPAYFTRTYVMATDTLTETITAHPDLPLGVMHYEYFGIDTLYLHVFFETRFRLMWPYSHHATGDLYYGFDKGLNASVVYDESRGYVMVLGTNGRILHREMGNFSGFETGKSPFPGGIRSDTFPVSGWMTVHLSPRQNRTDVIIAATSEGYDRGRQLYRRNMQYPRLVLDEAVAYSRQREEDHVQVITPDSLLNEGYRWARVGTDRLFVHTPGIGESLVAGYGTTAAGWDGGHAVNGRPGYAWYFGRDAIWCAMAMLHYGDFEKVRTMIWTFNRYQSPDGKIYHELTTSGFAHYDAADATPLYIILVGRYLRHSGDKAFIRKTWKHIRKAIDFCYSTDTDGDLLIENTNVGHGWVEGGALFGSKTTLYLASVWAEALREAAAITRIMNFDGYDRYFNDYERVVSLISEEFRGPDGFYAHGKNPDDTYHHVPTIMPAVPVLFGHIPAARSLRMIRSWSSNEFSTDWGTRIIGESSPYFNPEGYHTGSVWPLYTGWTALAEYRCGKSLQAFSHLMNNLRTCQHGSLGFMEEVFHGKMYVPRGVCAHQGWSETMAIQPLLEGMLGLDPDAADHSLKFAPAFPPHWDTVSVKQIRVGAHRMDFRMEKEPGMITFHFTHKGPRALHLDLSPVFPGNTKVMEVLVNGEAVQVDTGSFPSGMRANIPLKLRNRAKVDIRYRNMAAVMAHLPDVAPGDSSGTFRIIDTEYMAEGMRVIMEHWPGETAEWKIWSETKPGEVWNARLTGSEGNVYTYRTRFPDSSGNYVQVECFVPLPGE
ncbi:MAG: amylo-alpha-1,6-glucosidase [Bacteroidales bacterium]